MEKGVDGVEYVVVVDGVDGGDVVAVCGADGDVVVVVGVGKHIVWLFA